jgi:hypothetical protein
MTCRTRGVSLYSQAGVPTVREEQRPFFKKSRSHCANVVRGNRNQYEIRRLMDE